MTNPIFLGDWDNGNYYVGFEGIKYDFLISDVELEGVDILLAYYSYEQYEAEGLAFVLFRKDGALYEVNGGHCSCYGLEGQWKPEEVSLEELEHRLTKGKLGLGYGSDGYPNRFSNELKEIIATLK